MVRILKYILLSLASILILFLIFLFSRPDVFFNWIETREKTYPDFEAVIQEGGAGEKGGIGPGRWIPRFLPPSATDIIERHDIESNARWLFFHFNPQDLAVMVSACKEVTQSKIIYTRARVGGWWPEGLIGLSEDGRRPEDSHRQKVDYLFYQCMGEGTIAVNIEKKEVYFWDFVS